MRMGYMSTWVKCTRNFVGEMSSMSFPFDELPEVYVPQRTVLNLPDGQRVHTYQWCYLQRAVRSGSSAELNLVSLSPARVEAMPSVIRRLSQWFRFDGARPQSVAKHLRCIGQFLAWADSPEHEGRYEQVLPNADLALQALKGYHSYLRQLLQAHQIGANAAAARDQIVINAFSELHGRTFLDEIEPLSRVPSDGIRAPRDEEVAAFLSTVQGTFDSAAWLVLHDGGDANRASADHRMLRVSATDDSRVVTLAEGYSEVRLMELAAVAFAALVIGDSGANLAQIQDYEEPEDLEQQLAQPDRVNLTQKAIKLRAGGKTVPVSLTTTTLSRLRTYLQIRECLRVRLDCGDIAPLFVQCAYGNVKGFLGLVPVSLRALDKVFLSYLRSKFQVIGVKLPSVSLQQLRLFKQQDVLRKRGVKVAAEVMGHSIATAIRAYSKAQEDVRRGEMGKFLSGLESRVLECSDGPADDVPTVGIPTGSCRDHGSPVAIETESVVIPDCDKSEGCFFCAKFRVHADAQDARKLLSCRHVLQRLAPLQGESATADRVFVAVTDRIDALLKEIRHRAPDVHEHVRQDVEERGNLTRYWAVKLQQLYLLGMLPAAAGS